VFRTRAVADVHTAVMTTLPLRRTTEPDTTTAELTLEVADRSSTDPARAGASNRLAASRTNANRATWELTWVAGPDAGGRSYAEADADPVYVGRHHAAPIRCDDPALEPFHVEVALHADRPPTVTQLTGRRPTTTHVVDTTWSGTVTGEMEASAWDDQPIDIEIGHSVLRCRRHAATPRSRQSTTPVDRTDRTVVRTPRAEHRWAPRPITTDMAGLAADPIAVDVAGLVPIGVATVGAAVLAVVVRQPLMLLFALVGALASIASVGVTWARHRNATRRVETSRRDAAARLLEAISDQRSAWAAHVDRETWTIAHATEVANGDRPAWQRRADHLDAFQPSIGLGMVRTAVVTDGVRLDRSNGEIDVRHDGEHLLRDRPVTIDMGPASRLAVTGTGAPALARSLLTQIATMHGPADVQLLVVTASPDDWTWISSLPHVRSADGVRIGGDELALELLRDADRQLDRHTIVVVDDVAVLARRTSATRRLLDLDAQPATAATGESNDMASTALVAVLAETDADGVPAVCNTTVATHADATATVRRPGSGPENVRLAGASITASRAIAEALSCRRDPEDLRGNADDLASAVDLRALLADAGADLIDAGRLAARWMRHHDLPARVALGVAVDGVVEIDLDRDGPHALIAGTTGSGKSELLRSLVLGLCTSAGPDQLTFVLVDFKGGSTFADLERLPHVVGTVTDLDVSMTRRAIRSLRAELLDREHLLHRLGARDLRHARALTGTSVLPKLVVVIDEFAALATDHPDVLHAFVDLARRGRSLGIHLVLATQRPAGVVSDDVRANTDLRIALRVQDAADARDVVGDPMPASFGRRTPGRAALRLGQESLVVFQSAHLGGDLGDVLGAMAEAAALSGVGTPRRPWCTPLLPDLRLADVPRLATTDVDGTDDVAAVGLVDRPDLRRQDPVRWRMTDGHLAIAASAATDTGTILATLAACARSAQTRPEVIRITSGHDAEPETSPHSVPLHDDERFHRFLTQAAARLDGTRSGTACTPTLVAIEDLGALARLLDDPDRTAERQLFERLLHDGAAAGLVIVAAVGSPAAVPSTWRAALGRWWVGHLLDSTDAHLLGVDPDDVPSPVAGRLTIDGDLAQIATDTDLAPAGRNGPASSWHLDTLPTRVAWAAPAVRTHDGVEIPVGTAHDDLGRVALHLADGEHALVVGHSRTGRSTALHALAVAWHDGAIGDVIAIAPRRSPLHDAPDVRSFRSVSAALAQLDRIAAAPEVDSIAHDERDRLLIVIDDAELVDDQDGRLAALLADPHVTVIAAGRPDALRASYGHWTTIVRRSRIGIVLTGGDEFDAELLGTTTPRRLPIAPRPGLAHVVGDGSPRLVQLVSCRVGRDQLVS
jgi:DNA segregation ATPase FtsK/SpoIIIE, S-DNA-T family